MSVLHGVLFHKAMYNVWICIFSSEQFHRRQQTRRDSIWRPQRPYCQTHVGPVHRLALSSSIVLWMWCEWVLCCVSWVYTCVKQRSCRQTLWVAAHDVEFWQLLCDVPVLISFITIDKPLTGFHRLHCVLYAQRTCAVGVDCVGGEWSTLPYFSTLRSPHSWHYVRHWMLFDIGQQCVSSGRHTIHYKRVGEIVSERKCSISRHFMTICLTF